MLPPPARLTDVTKDPQGTHGRGHVEAEEAADALRLALGGDLEHVLLGRESKAVAVDLNLDVGHCGDLAAVDDGLTLGDGGGANGLVQGLDLVSGAGHERGASVGNGAAVATVVCATDAQAVG